MVMRGVQKVNSKTITSKLIGKFKDDKNVSDEFYKLLNTSSS